MNCYKYLLCIVTILFLSELYHYQKANECHFALDKCNNDCISNEYECLKCIGETSYDCCEYIFPGQKVCNHIKKHRSSIISMRPKTYMETLAKYIRLRMNQKN